MRALAKDREQRYQSAREMQQALEDFVRRERIPVSTIALNHFMQSLFEDKLATMKEALLQGSSSPTSSSFNARPTRPTSTPRLSQSVLSAPGASRTLTGVNAARPRRGLTLVVVAAGLALGVGGGAAGCSAPRSSTLTLRPP